ncbi:proline-rich domain-containing protein [Streptomyces sp. NPDC005476]|uniref:proline-rich domain-containing protein n=1 Tax=Streptomyces sp. NPDC005476 TaxID=3156882 RepID=UPI003452B517
MTGARRSWTDGSLTVGSFLKPYRVASAVFHPVWIPDALDPTVERLKRGRVIAGAVAALGVYTFVQGGFAFEEMLENTVIASAVLFVLTPVTVGVMLLVWRRTGTVRQLRTPLVDSLKLLLLFVGCVLATVGIFQASERFGLVPKLLLYLVGLWMAVLLIVGAVRLSGNFFGSAAVHRCLPPLLATVTAWLMAVPDLFTGDLHGLSLTLGIVFILGAPVTVTGLALLEMRRLKQRYGIRLTAHPATLPPTPVGEPPQVPPQVPQQAHPYGQQHGHPYAPGPGQPYPQGNPYLQGNPYQQGSPYQQGATAPHAPSPRHPYGSHGSHNGQNPYGG